MQKMKQLSINYHSIVLFPLVRYPSTLALFRPPIHEHVVLSLFQQTSDSPRILHTSASPHLFDNLLILDHQSSSLQYLLQSFKNALKGRFGSLFLRETRNGDVGAAAAVEKGVEFGGDGERGDSESCRAS